MTHTAPIHVEPIRPSVTPSRSVVLASVAGLLAAWLAAGSLGIVAEPLGRAAIYLLVALALIAVWDRQHGASRWIWVALGIWLVPLCLPTSPLQTLLLVTATWNLLASSLDGGDRRCLRAVAVALLVLVAYRWCCESVGLVWWLSDQLGRGLGELVGWLAQRRLRVGASFAGVDFLVVMWVLFAQRLLRVGRSELRQTLAAGLAILLAHGVYLVVLAWAWDIFQWLPRRPDPTFDHPYIPPAWDWARAAGAWLPWNVPVLAACLHAIVAALLLRCTPWCDDDGPLVHGATGFRAWSDRASRGNPPALAVAAYAAAVALPLLGCYAAGGRDLQGKRLLANAQGYLDWQVPQHDQYGRDAAGTFGMLPAYVKMLGGQLNVSAEFGAAELNGADAVLLLYPSESLGADAQQRIWDYVRGGGTLLVVGQTAVLDAALPDSLNPLLAATRMRVRRDVALSGCNSWEPAGHRVGHPAVRRGLADSILAEDGGASIELGWAAWPIVVGRWGWSDPGGDALLTNAARCERGERLGDLVLAAEQRVGRGTVLVMGTERPLTNEGIVFGHPLVSRLLDYVAHRGSSPNALWRQLVSLLVVLVWLLAAILLPQPSHGGGLVLAWLAATVVCQLLPLPGEPAVPDGRRLASGAPDQVRRLAYLDASHLELYSHQDWVFDGINGLALNLMRNGYLPLSMPDWAPARLQTADMLVSIAPQRRFTSLERRQLNDFVMRGGSFVCTVGAEHALPSQDLLADFGVRVPFSPVPTSVEAVEPLPLGHVRSLFLEVPHEAGNYRVGVVLHAGWPVESAGGNLDVLVRGPQNTPAVVWRSQGAGKIVVVGDSAFAVNKNLEYIGGEPFNGRHENARFWRWLITTRLTPGPAWIPPLETPVVEPEDESATTPNEIPNGAPAVVPNAAPAARQESVP